MRSAESRPATIDAYLSRVKGERRTTLDSLRRTIRAIVPRPRSASATASRRSVSTGASSQASAPRQGVAPTIRSAARPSSRWRGTSPATRERRARCTSGRTAHFPSRWCASWSGRASPSGSRDAAA